MRVPLIYRVGVDPGIHDANVPVHVVDDAPARLEFTLLADSRNSARSDG